MEHATIDCVAENATVHTGLRFHARIIKLACGHCTTFYVSALYSSATEVSLPLPTFFGLSAIHIVDIWHATVMEAGWATLLD